MPPSYSARRKRLSARKNYESLTCVACNSQHKKCSKDINHDFPCDRCERQGINCQQRPYVRPRGRPLGSRNKVRRSNPTATIAEEISLMATSPPTVSVKSTSTKNIGTEQLSLLSHRFAQDAEINAEIISPSNDENNHTTTMMTSTSIITTENERSSSVADDDFAAPLVVVGSIADETMWWWCTSTAISTSFSSVQPPSNISPFEVPACWPNGNGAITNQLAPPTPLDAFYNMHEVNNSNTPTILSKYSDDEALLSSTLNEISL
ncbi:hypothetical protein BDF20DRAFT_1000018 [Mycotypha africana]|uniref:uncharacterized protein n=1 Tax=Mycotypha africana TaxID=64632 RepID=UPI002301AD89|nr:uncharacterized protein BDF20DRAFT_1000018 [Mycotypha africana]KAI8981966.1 hypothetical protein BDF20DRAFT_1000018 [Mycotypha africana]